jgi:hypothetical protein
LFPVASTWQGGMAVAAGIQRPMTNPGRPWIRTTFQLISAIPALPEASDRKFVEAYRCVIFWVRDRVPERLPQAAWDGQSFRMEWPGQKVEVIAIPERGVWSFRLEHPDMPFGNRPAVPGRTWTTDITFTKREQGLSVGVRSFCASLPYGDAEVVFTRPRVVVELAQRLGLTDQRNLSREPWLLATEQDLNEFKAFLTNASRLLPVVVLSQPDKTRFNVTVSDFVLDPVELAKRTLGLAHVIQLPWELGYKWTEMVGKPWSVYLGAVRTYMPGLDFENDPPSWHPSTFAEKVIFWKQPGDDHVGEGPFTDFLVDRLHLHAATRRLEWGDLLFISEARTKQVEVARSKASETSDWKQLYEEQIAALDKKIEELEQDAKEHSDEALRSAKERDAYKDDNRQLRYQVDGLRQALSERTGGKSESDILIPDNYDDLPEWAAQHLTGRLVLHSRALRGLKDAIYEDVGLVYRSLLLLANEYRNQCLGRGGAKEAYEEKMGEFGLRFSRSISKERAGEQGDDYFVRFPTASSGKRLLESHLRKGSTKDDRYCLGIYFFWDDDTQQVVVGWLPSHLDNRMT